MNDIISATEVRIRKILIGYIVTKTMPRDHFNRIIELIREQHSILLERCEECEKLIEENDNLRKELIKGLKV